MTSCPVSLRYAAMACKKGASLMNCGRAPTILSNLIFFRSAIENEVFTGDKIEDGYQYGDHRFGDHVPYIRIGSQHVHQGYIEQQAQQRKQVERTDLLGSLVLSPFKNEACVEHI